MKELNLHEDEQAKEYRLQQFLKWEGGWEAIYYALTPEERQTVYDRLRHRIEVFESGAENANFS